MKSIQLKHLRKGRDKAFCLTLRVPLFMSKRRFKRLAKNLLKNSYGSINGIPMSQNGCILGDFTMRNTETLIDYMETGLTTNFMLIVNKKGRKLAKKHFNPINIRYSPDVSGILLAAMK